MTKKVESNVTIDAHLKWEDSQRRVLLDLMELTGIPSIIGETVLAERISFMPIGEVTKKIALLRDGLWNGKKASVHGHEDYSFNKLKTMEILIARSIVDFGFAVDDYSNFEQKLWDEIGVKVRQDGLCEFKKLTQEVLSILDGLASVVYHYTSSAVWDSIKKNGLMPKTMVAQLVEYNQCFDSLEMENPGRCVYLTSMTSGYLVEMYEETAVKKFGGKPLRIDVEVDVVELLIIPESDAAQHHLNSGTEFYMETVPSKQIINFR